VLAGIGSLLGFFMVVMMVIWVVYSIYAGFKINMSQGKEEDVKTGFTLIKNVWISITWGVAFFILLSIIGTFMGVGNVTQWSYNLAQCNGAAGGFYFRDRAAAESLGLPADQFWCCTVAKSNSGTRQQQDLGYQAGTNHYIGVAKDASPDSSLYTGCTFFK
jgi:hypothetical protein